MRSGEGVQTNPKESGKPSDRMTDYLYIVLFLLLCLVPFAGLALGKHSGAGERADMTGFPSVTTADGGVNLEYLQQAGDWFQVHFVRSWSRQMRSCILLFFMSLRQIR